MTTSEAPSATPDTPNTPAAPAPPSNGQHRPTPTLAADLSSSEIWAAVTIDGVERIIPVAASLARLSEIDARHATASAAGQAGQTSESDSGSPAGNPAGSQSIQSIAWQEDIAKLLREKYDFPRADLAEAAAFYNFIVTAADENKKKLGLTLESPSISMSTPPDGTPNESSASSPT